MSRQKRVNRWGSAVWCLSLQIMNSCVFTSYHFSPLRWWESKTCSISGRACSCNSDNTRGDMSHMSLFSVFLGSIDSRWRKLDGVIKHTSHIIFSCLCSLLFFDMMDRLYISKNRLYSLISTKKQLPPLRSPSELSCFYWESIKSLMLFWRSSNYVFCMHIYCTFICTLTVDLFWIFALLILWFSCVEISIFAKTTNLKFMYS